MRGIAKGSLAFGLALSLAACTSESVKSTPISEAQVTATTVDQQVVLSDLVLQMSQRRSEVIEDVKDRKLQYSGILGSCAIIQSGQNEISLTPNPGTLVVDEGPYRLVQNFGFHDGKPVFGTAFATVLNQNSGGSRSILGGIPGGELNGGLIIPTPSGQPSNVAVTIQGRSNVATFTDGTNSLHFAGELIPVQGATDLRSATNPAEASQLASLCVRLMDAIQIDEVAVTNQNPV